MTTIHNDTIPPTASHDENELMKSSPISHALHDLEHATGIVIPVYFNATSDPDPSIALLGSTVQMFVREISEPQNLCLSVDGPGVAVAIAEAVATRYGVRMVVGERNRGKFGALLHGMQTLFDNTKLLWFAAVDQDGDHFANDLLNFVRAAQHVVEATGDDRVMVLGNRASRHRPLGFLRAEQEELCNHLLLDALTYAAAISGNPLHLEYLTTHDSVPDFHSGYKFFSRPTAHAVFAQEPPLVGLSETAAYRHACEAVMTVEAHLSGAILAAINRRTYDEQPISLFAGYNRASLAADMILWPCKRLGVPANFVAQWLTNHLPKLLLGTLVPQGPDELRAIYDLVLKDYGLDPEVAQHAFFTRPRFV